MAMLIRNIKREVWSSLFSEQAKVSAPILKALPVEMIIGILAAQFSAKL